MPERILLLSYFYKPCNLTASQRTHAWAKYLHEFDYYPVVVTRNWDIPIQTPPDGQKSTGTELRHIKHDNYEEYYLPYKANLRDRVLNKYYGTRWHFLSRLLSFWELLVQNLTLRILPYYNIYEFIDQYLGDNEDITKVVISGNPFILFAFGYHLKKKHNIKWIADYRDDWSTSSLTDGHGLARQILKPIEAHSERKWVGSADLITSISPYYTQKISEYVNVKGRTLLNGYFEEEVVTLPEAKLYDIFTLTYVGTLYNTQPIELLLNALKRLIDELGENANIQIKFPGLSYMAEANARVKACMQGYEQYVHITSRIPKREVMLIQQNSHILLNVTHIGIKGVAPSKVFEYIGLKKRVLSAPKEEWINEMLEETTLGLLADNEEECYEQLKFAYMQYKQGNLEWFAPSTPESEKYSRRYSAQKLAEILHSV